jgi:hypothetical protein
MNNSIQHFIEKGIVELSKAADIFYKSPENLDEFIDAVIKPLLEFGIEYVSEVLQDSDECIRNSMLRKECWNINRREKTQLLTRLGNIIYERTLFQNKKTGEYRYLLDDLMGLEPHARMTAGAEAALIEEAIDTSYRKGGLFVSMTDSVSKQTVKNKIHELVIEEELKVPEVKKKVEVLYIDADEDHIAEQAYSGEKGNTIIGKIIYLYEGKRLENAKSHRHCLIGKHYFGGVYEGRKGNEALWMKVWKYIDCHYDTEYLKRIYINGDGGEWIKEGCRMIEKSHFVLDKYHLMNRINVATVHLLDSAEDVKAMIYEAISSKDRSRLRKTFREIKAVTENEKKLKDIEESEKYILNHWKAIIIRVGNPEILGCSAEGHVSHTYSSRMSSRPMGWSRHGADQMCRLRCYKENGGKIIDLIKRQRELSEIARTGTDGDRILVNDYIRPAFRKRPLDDSYYLDRIHASIPGYTAKKVIWFNTHLRNI